MEGSASSGWVGGEAVDAGSWRSPEEPNDLPPEFLALLATAQDGGACVAECLRTFSRTRRMDGPVAHLAWSDLAETSRTRAESALQEGHIITARRNWLRAITYYDVSAQALDDRDRRRWRSVRLMRECARQFLLHRVPAGEIVRIPWTAGHPLQGCFLPAPVERPGAAVICIGEPGARKERLLGKYGVYAGDAGFSMLALDLLGTKTDASMERLIRAGTLERAIPAAVDYLLTRKEVDPQRIGIVADNWSSSFVARAVSSEPRLSAAVCDAGLWDLHERDFLARRGGTSPVRTSSLARSSPIARCPVLMTLGAEGWLQPDRVRNMVRALNEAGADISLKIFGVSETACAQAHADNPALANEYIFDWLTDRL
jgi:dienelactone hydrolase